MENVHCLIRLLVWNKREDKELVGDIFVDYLLFSPLDGRFRDTQKIIFALDFTLITLSMPPTIQTRYFNVSLSKMNSVIL